MDENKLAKLALAWKAVQALENVSLDTWEEFATDMMNAVDAGAYDLADMQRHNDFYYAIMDAAVKNRKALHKATMERAIADGTKYRG